MGVVAAVLGALSFIISLGDVGKAVEVLSITIAATDIVLALALLSLWRAFFVRRKQ